MFVNKLLLMAIALELAALLYVIGKSGTIGKRMEAAGVALILFNIFTLCFAILARTEPTLFGFRIGLTMLFGWIIVYFVRILKRGHS